MTQRRLGVLALVVMLLADAVLLLASPWARAITGQNLVVAGGLVMD